MSPTIRRIFMFLVAGMAALALALGPAALPAQAVVDAEDDCIDDVGTWVGESGSSTTGICYFFVTEASGLCPGPADFYAIAVLDNDWYAVTCVEEVGDLGDFVAIGSLGAVCVILGGGIWSGSFSGKDGTCNFPEGTDAALTECGPGYDLVLTVVENLVVDLECVVPGSGSGGGGGSDSRVPGFGRFGSAVNGSTGGGTLSMSGGKNGNVTFDPGTCLGKCTLGPNLPAGAAASLPSDAVAWMYFKSVDEDGNPGTGSYTVCFDVGDLASPVIYRYVSGAWVAQPVTLSGGQVCTTASGDGAFALGGS